MVAEIFCVGTELLIGDVVNTNAAFLSKELSMMGIDVYYHSVCGDNPNRLKACLTTALARSSLVVLTGGLGPTYDDLTKETVAQALGLPMEMHEESFARMTAYFARSGRTMTENNKKQAMMPRGAIVFPNDHGTAPGLAVEQGDKIVIMLPGPPREMKPMVLDSVLPYLRKFSDHILCSSNVNIFGMGEAAVEQQLRPMMESAVNPTVAPYVHDGEVRLRVTASAKTEKEARALILPVTQEIVRALGNVVYGVDEGPLEQVLVTVLAAKRLTVAFAESCTGGLCAKRVTSIPGASEVFGYGLCTYANEAKMQLLGVESKTLEQYGAVSQETAVEMAQGLQKLSGADIAISTTGIAGPGGGSADKPVGLVYIGVCTKHTVHTLRLMLGRTAAGEREYIRTLASSHALKAALDAANRLEPAGE